MIFDEHAKPKSREDTAGRANFTQKAYVSICAKQEHEGIKTGRLSERPVEEMRLSDFTMFPQKAACDGTFSEQSLM